MAQVYGGRWRLTDKANIGGGGQGDVFRVVDARDEYKGEFALKRVRNPERHERFRNEIEAIKRLSHPNIIKLIDHSALDDTGAEPTKEKQFLVMPIAAAGDLSKAQRSSLYKDMIDGTLQVAMQLASALALAHASNVIHRDVKPANILFTGNAHDVWLTDFGICLLREQERATETGEVVGPRAFMALELEEGGKLDVTPAADIYSLGKVIYYMLSGGTILPREQLHVAPFDQVFRKGERHRLVGLLLRRMICPLQDRIKDMQEVFQELKRIEAWEQNARLLPLDKDALDGIERLQRRASDARRIAAENAEARSKEAHAVAAVTAGFLSWLKVELEKAAAHIRSGGMTCEVRDAAIFEDSHFDAGGRVWYVPKVGFDLVLVDDSESPGHRHILEIFLCEIRKLVVTAHSGTTKPDSEAAKDRELAFVPIYRQFLLTPEPRSSGIAGFLSAKSAIGGTLLTDKLVAPEHLRRRARARAVQIAPITRSLHRDFTQRVDFRVSEWPGITEKLDAALAEAIGVFIAFIDAGANTVGP